MMKILRIALYFYKTILVTLIWTLILVVVNNILNLDEIFNTPFTRNLKPFIWIIIPLLFAIQDYCENKKAIRKILK